MFHTVRLQPADSAKALAALGLKLKRKKGAHYIFQPCPGLRQTQCSIYDVRPERCRLFACRQLQRVAAGETSEAAAREKIREVQQRVTHIDSLLAQAGTTDPKRPLAKRCEKIMAEPLDASADQATVALRDQIAHAMQELEAILDRDFRPVPKAADNPEEEPLL